MWEVTILQAGERPIVWLCNTVHCEVLDGRTWVCGDGPGITVRYPAFADVTIEYVEPVF